MCAELGGELMRRRLMMAMGMEDDEVKEWKLIRTITIPDSVPEESNGIVFAEQANGGFWFGFDSDDSGDPFSVTELFCRYNAGTSNEVAIHNALCVDISTKTPTYKSTRINPVPAIFGKTGVKIYGWFRIDTILDKSIQYGTYNNGSTMNNLSAIRDYNILEITNLPISKISTFLLNYKEYGFESGSTFEFYGR